ncbi:ATP-binding protein [Kibdelosporangium persicum]|nr:ATP-binding protein [Kibdelosporangium persicum]
MTTQLMPDDQSLNAWARTLPPAAADVVARSDLAHPHVHMRFPATPAQVGVARAQVTEWTRRLGLPTVHGQDIVLATDEAISNAVEHAYPGDSGTLTLFAARIQPDHAVRIIVSDEGEWRPPPENPGFRGRGLVMMERLAEVFELAHTPLGTTVVLGWPATPDSRADDSDLAVPWATHDQ